MCSMGFCVQCREAGEQCQCGPYPRLMDDLFGDEAVIEINMVNRNMKVSLGVDSGAEPTVWPSDLFPEMAPLQPNDASRKGACYWAPDDLEYPSIPDEGKRGCQLKAGGEPRTLAPHIAPVRKPPASAADMNDNGHDLFFPSDGQAVAVHKESGAVTLVNRIGNRFEIEAEVVLAPSRPPVRRGLDL